MGEGVSDSQKQKQCFLYAWRHTDMRPKGFLYLEALVRATSSAKSHFIKALPLSWSSHLQRETERDPAIWSALNSSAYLSRTCQCQSPGPSWNWCALSDSAAIGAIPDKTFEEGLHNLFPKLICSLLFWSPRDLIVYLILQRNYPFAW